MSAVVTTHHCFAISFSKFRVSDSEHTHFCAAVTNAIIGCMCCGIPGVIYNAIAVQTMSTSCSEICAGLEKLVRCSHYPLQIVESNPYRGTSRRRKATRHRPALRRTDEELVLVAVTVRAELVALMARILVMVF